MILQVTTCPVCMEWERDRRFIQLDLELGNPEGVAAAMSRSEPDDPILPVILIVDLDDGLPF